MDFEAVEFLKIYEKESYKIVAIKSNRAFLEFLLIEELDFTIIVHTNIIEFNPIVPKKVIEFDKLVRLDIANYTLESARLNEDALIIETAFGIENFESTLTIPFEAIFQIALNNDLLAINYYEPKIESDSMEIFLNNPQNLEILKKRKK